MFGFTYVSYMLLSFVLSRLCVAHSMSMHVCVQCTRFIQFLTRTDRSTIVLQFSLRAPTLTPKYIP